MALLAALNSKKQILYAMVWLVATALLAATLQIVSIQEAVGDDESSSTAPTPDFVITETEELPNIDSADSGLYAGALWEMGDVRIEPSDQLLGRAVVQVDVSVTNVLEHTQIRLPDSQIHLVSDNGGREDRARFIDAGSRLVLGPGETEEVTIEFIVGFNQDPDPTDLSLEIAQMNREPSVVRLQGIGDGIDRPVRAAIESATVTAADPDNVGRSVIIEPSAATISLNAGPYRALKGDNLALITVNVQRSTEDAPGLVSNDFWALDADGERTKPVVVSRTGRPAKNTDELTLLFSFPRDTDKISLVSSDGAEDETNHIIARPSV